MAFITAGNKMQERLIAAHFKALLIEDVDSVLLAIQDFLQPTFEVYSARDIPSGMLVLEETKASGEMIDLIIADINYHDSNFFSALEMIRERFPFCRIILITASDINIYIKAIEKFQINQVISKHSILLLHDIYVAAYKMLTQDIFGITKYFSDINVNFINEHFEPQFLENRSLYSTTICSAKDRDYWSDRALELFGKNNRIPVSLIRLVVDELTVNAMVRAPRRPDGSYKYQRKIKGKDMFIPIQNIVLEPEDYFIFQYGIYDDWLFVCSLDPQGSLTQKEILYRLSRNLSIDQKTGLPESMNDTHGRGIFIMRENLTHLIFNIDYNKKTEIICLYNLKHDLPYKNISIYEINAPENDDGKTR